MEALLTFVSLADPQVAEPTVEAMLKEALTAILLQMPLWTSVQRGQLFDTLVTSGVAPTLLKVQRNRRKRLEAATEGVVLPPLLHSQEDNEELTSLVNLLMLGNTEFTPSTLEYFVLHCGGGGGVKSEEEEDPLLVEELPTALRVKVWERSELLWRSYVDSTLYSSSPSLSPAAAGQSPADDLVGSLLWSVLSMATEVQLVPTSTSTTAGASGVGVGGTASAGGEPRLSSEGVGGEPSSSGVLLLNRFHELWEGCPFVHRAQQLRESLEMSPNIQVHCASAGGAGSLHPRPNSPVPMAMTQSNIESLKGVQEGLLDGAMSVLFSLCLPAMVAAMATASVVQQQQQQGQQRSMASLAQHLMLALLYTELDVEEAQARSVQEALQKPVSGDTALLSFVEETPSVVGALGASLGNSLLPSTVAAMRAPICCVTLCFAVIEQASVLTAASIDSSGATAGLSSLFHALSITFGEHTAPAKDTIPGSSAAAAVSVWCSNELFLRSLLKLVATDVSQSQPLRSKFSFRVKTDAHYKFLYDRLCPLLSPSGNGRMDGQNQSSAASVTRLSATKIKLRPSAMELELAAMQSCSLRGFNVFLTCYYVWMLRQTGVVQFRQTGLKYVEKLKPVLQQGSLECGGWYEPLADCVREQIQRELSSSNGDKNNMGMKEEGGKEQPSAVSGWLCPETWQWVEDLGPGENRSPTCSPLPTILTGESTAILTHGGEDAE